MTIDMCACLSTDGCKHAYILLKKWFVPGRHAVAVTSSSMDKGSTQKKASNLGETACLLSLSLMKLLSVSHAPARSDLSVLSILACSMNTAKPIDGFAQRIWPVGFASCPVNRIFLEEGWERR